MTWNEKKKKKNTLNVNNECQSIASVSYRVTMLIKFFSAYVPKTFERAKDFFFHITISAHVIETVCRGIFNVISTSVSVSCP